MVEIPYPVTQPIPDRRVAPLEIPGLPKEGVVRNRDLVEAYGVCLDRLHAANLDRAWLREWSAPE